MGHSLPTCSLRTLRQVKYPSERTTTTGSRATARASPTYSQWLDNLQIWVADWPMCKYMSALLLIQGGKVSTRIHKTMDILRKIRPMIIRVPWSTKNMTSRTMVFTGQKLEASKIHSPIVKPCACIVNRLTLICSKITTSTVFDSASRIAWIEVLCLKPYKLCRWRRPSEVQRLAAPWLTTTRTRLI